MSAAFRTQSGRVVASTEDYKSFKEWDTLGYRIQKGEKSSHRDPETSAALFGPHQVWRPLRP